jgi:mannose-1-phosphate guanylyltransferase/mannose-6-phosphate isomerase
MFEASVISTGEEQRFFVVDQLEVIGVTPAAILLEPVARNTAPAIAAAALWALGRGEDEPMLVMPSDHLIRDTEGLHATIKRALPSALAGNLLTFGIEPTEPKTCYGYIQAGGALGDGEVRRVERFVEKPDRELARSFLGHGGYYWNSGMFLFRPSVFVAELRAHAPDIAAQVEIAMRDSTSDKLFVRPDSSTFAAARSISVDYAVMEHSDKVLVVPASFDWSDLGSWDAVHELMPADEQGNVLRGDVLAIDVRNSMIRSDADLTVAAVGLDGMLCVPRMSRTRSRNFGPADTHALMNPPAFTAPGEAIRRWIAVSGFRRSGSLSIRAPSYRFKSIITAPSIGSSSAVRPR